MDTDHAILIYACAVGLTLAGATATLFRLVTGRELRFQMRATESATLIVCALVLRLAAGPLLLLRASISPEISNHQAVGLCAFGLSWGLATGIVILASLS